MLPPQRAAEGLHLIGAAARRRSRAATLGNEHFSQSFRRCRWSRRSRWRSFPVKLSHCSPPEMGGFLSEHAGVSRAFTPMTGPPGTWRAAYPPPKRFTTRRIARTTRWKPGRSSPDDCLRARIQAPQSASYARPHLARRLNRRRDRFQHRLLEDAPHRRIPPKPAVARATRPEPPESTLSGLW